MKKRLIVILPILSGVLWGSVGVFVRILSDFGVNNPTILSSRVLIASIIMLFFLLFYDKSLLKIKWKDSWILIASGILGMLGMNLCYNEAVNQLSLSLAAVLLSLSPLFVILLAAFFFKERATFKKLGCMALAVIGCLLVSGILEQSSGLKWITLGIIIGFLAAFFYALYSVFSKVAMARGYQALTITFYSLVTVAIVLIPFTDWNILGEFIGQSYVGNSVFIIVNSLFTSVLPYVLYTIGLRHIDAGKASILAAGCEPITAMGLGVIFYSEVPTILSVIGLIVTISALALLCIPESSPVKKQNHEPLRS